MHLSVVGNDTVVFIGDELREQYHSINFNDKIILIGDLVFVKTESAEYIEASSQDFIDKQDYNEFCRLYYNKIRSIVAGFSGICREDIEDETQKIITEFIRGQYLSIYSKDKQAAFAEARYKKQLALYESGHLDFKPERHLGKFSSFVWQFVKVRLMGIRDKSNRRISIFRSLNSYIEIKTESTSGNSNSGDEIDTSLAVFFAVPDNEYQNIETRELCKNVYKHLLQIGVPTLTRNFPELFLVVIEDGFTKQEGFDRLAYAERKGITVSAVSMQLRELREHLIQYGFKRDLQQLLNARQRVSK